MTRSSDAPPWPALPEDELLRLASDIASSGELTRGRYVQLLEQKMEERFRGYHAVAVSSATTGLEAVLAAWDVDGKIVGIPEYGFPAAGVVARRAGAYVQLLPVDDDLHLNPGTVDGVDVVVAVDVEGRACDYPTIEDQLDDHQLLLEDAACAWGGSCEGVPCGTFGHAAVFSLSQSKVMGAGEGGVVVTSNPQLAERIRTLRRYGESGDKVSRRRTFAWAGSNWKLTEFTAGVALIQLGRLDERLAVARANAAMLDVALAECNYLCGYPDADRQAPHKYRVVAAHDVKRSRLVAAARALAIPVLEDDVAPLWQSPLFSSRVRTTPVSGVLERSFLIGSRAYPIWHVDSETVGRWCGALAELDKEADRWIR